jgi:choline dehydrogenase-like flavoprotein
VIRKLTAELRRHIISLSDSNFFENHRAILTKIYRTVLYQGTALGGSSMIFGAVAMRPKQFVFDEWREKSGVTELNAETLEPHYRHIAEVMTVTRQTSDMECGATGILTRG